MNNTKQVALVTGANKGIGFETARQLAQRGFIVWLGSRDETRGVAAVKALANDGDVRFVRLDVTDLESVRAAADRIGKETGALDVLINNAGVLVDDDSLPSTVPLDALARTFDVNFYGLIRVTQAFLPLVQRAKAGRIVNVSSTMGSVTTVVAPDSPLAQFPTFAYASSKTAVSAVTAWLALELRGTPIKVNAICPGYNDTDLNKHAGHLHPSEGAKVAVRAATLEANGPTGTFFDANGTVGW
ncbi:MAG: SDR family oxidoreductase [Polyangiales bacterium]